MEYSVKIIKKSIFKVLNAQRLFARDVISFIIFLFLGFVKREKVIIVYHSVGNINTENDPYRINILPEIFEKHLRIIARNRNNIEINFDDGYQNNYTNAFALLKKYNLSATIFLITDFIDEKITSDKFSGQEFREAPLRWEDIRVMHESGMKFGSHSKTHRIFINLSKDELAHELLDSKSRIEKNVGCLVEKFAYPFGNINSFNDSTKCAVKDAKYNYAYTNILGDNSDIPKDKFALKRIRIYSEDGPFRFRMKIKGAYDWIDKLNAIKETLFTRNRK